MKILSINHKVKDENARLLLRMQKGDKQAFALIFNKYQAACYNVALKFLKSHELSRTAVEEIFIQVWIKRREIKDLQAFIFNTTKDVTIARLQELAIKYFKNEETRT